MKIFLESEYKNLLKYLLSLRTKGPFDCVYLRIVPENVAWYYSSTPFFFKKGSLVCFDIPEKPCRCSLSDKLNAQNLGELVKECISQE